MMDVLIYGYKGKNSGSCLILRFLSLAKVYFVKLYFIPRNLRFFKVVVYKKIIHKTIEAE